MSKKIITPPSKGNKNGTSGKKVKGSSGKTAVQAAVSPEPGYVTIRVGSSGTDLALASLNQAAVQDVVEQVNQGKQAAKPVELSVSDPTGWSPPDRGRFWNLYRMIRADGTRQVSLRAGEKVFAQPADWAASGLLHPTDDAAVRCRCWN